MHDILDLDTYPLDRPQSLPYAALVTRCRAALAADGMFNLTGFMRAGALEEAVSKIRPVMRTKRSNIGDCTISTFANPSTVCRMTIPRCSSSRQ